MYPEKKTLVKIAESVLMTIQQDMEKNPEKYQNQEIPSHDQVLQFMDNSPNYDLSSQDYQVKTAEEIIEIIHSGKQLLNE